MGYNREPSAEGQYWIPAMPEAEIGIIDSALLNPHGVAGIVKAFDLKPEDFFSERQGVIWQAILDLHNHRLPIEQAMIQGKVDTLVKGRDVRVWLSDNPASALYAQEYAGEIKRASFNRNLIHTAGKIAEFAYENLPIDQAIQKMAQLTAFIYDVNSGKGLRHAKAGVGTTVNDIMDAHEKGIHPGFMTGFALLDRLLGGLQSGDLIIIGARPGLGKSAFVLSIVENLRARVNPRVAYFSLEMPEKQLITRLLSMISRIDSHRLKMGQLDEDGNEPEILLEAANELIKANLYIDDNAGATIEYVETESRALARQLEAEGEKLDLIIIDHMHIMADGDRKWDDNKKYDEITRRLAELAKELDLPVVALSQLSRALTTREDKRPMLSDFRGSGGIEQNASVIIGLHRDGYYNDECENPNLSIAIVLKHRHGDTGACPMLWRPEYTQFVNVDIHRTDLE